jgi:RNAse (barnase) inhibitor barstar
MGQKKTYEIDGTRFSTLEEFYHEISTVLIPGAPWGRNLDAFNDILSGGFGTPDEGFVIIWKNSDQSRKRLGYPETVRCLNLRLKRCHHRNRPQLRRDLERAKSQTGPTVFDWLVKIIIDHAPGGSQPQDGVDLVLD